MKKQNSPQNNPRKQGHLRLQRLVVCAFLVAVSIVMGKYLKIPVGEVLRFSFENLPVIMGGIIFGPLAGAAIGVVADLVGCIMVGYAINPILTVGAAAIGLVSGGVNILMRRAEKIPFSLRILASSVLAHVVGSVLIKTFGLSAFYDLPLWELMLWRLLNYFIVAAAEFFILYYVLKNKTIASHVAKTGGRT